MDILEGGHVPWGVIVKRQASVAIGAGGVVLALAGEPTVVGVLGDAVAGVTVAFAPKTKKMEFIK